MENLTLDWRPTPEEVARVVAEMRPIIREFARRSEADLRAWARAAEAVAAAAADPDTACH